MKKSTLASWFIATLVALALAAPASAAQPDRAPWIAPDPFVLAAGDACEFAVLVEVVANREYTLTFSDDSGNAGRSITTGQLVVRLTNAGDPSRSVTLNISGPGFGTANADGTYTFVLSGVSLPLEPGTLYVSMGPITLNFDSDGNLLEPVLSTGTTKDICPLLA